MPEELKQFVSRLARLTFDDVDERLAIAESRYVKYIDKYGAAKAARKIRAEAVKIALYRTGSTLFKVVVTLIRDVA